jgi:sulfur carrier protein
MKVQINGELTGLRDGLSISELLVEHKVQMPDMVSVELNGEILSRGNFPQTQVRDGDRVEFLYFMGGGK